LIAWAILWASAYVALAADDPLTALAERFQLQQQRYDDAFKQAPTDEAKGEVFRTLHPYNALVADFLALEESHRGQPAAISALYHLMRHANSVGEADLPASQGRIAAMRVAREHYMTHPDLGLLLAHFTGGCFVPEAEAWLQDAMKSPHRAVQAAARFQLARFLAIKAQLAEMFGPDAAPASPHEHPALVEVRRKLREQFKELAIDPAKEREKAVAVIDEVVSEYLELERIFLKAEGPGKLSIRRCKPEEVGGKATTYAKLCEALRFELQHLQRGQRIPEIVGKDADGVEFKLSDYRGRVVLLLFSANWCGPCKAMYPDLRKLAGSLASDSFAILAVMGDKQPESVISDTEKGEIRWRTTYDGDDGPLVTAWNIQSWPTAFLIDHNGMIITRNPERSYDWLKTEIGKLLAVQNADPAAKRHVEDHPLPELPILKRQKKLPE